MKRLVRKLLVFQRFIPASGLLIDEGSPENRKDPNPDILCTISGQNYFFELGRIINEEVAEKLNPDRRKLGAGFSYDMEKPLRDVIDKKATRTYLTDGAPVDLILHFDLRLGSATRVERLAQKHAALLDSLTTTGPFRRVWVFDEHTRAVMWSKV